MAKRNIESLGPASACESAHKKIKTTSNNNQVHNICQKLSTFERLPTELLERIFLATRGSELIQASPFIAARLSHSESRYYAIIIDAFYGRDLPQLRKYFRFEHLLPSRRAEYTSWEERHAIRSCLQASWCTIQFAMRFSQGLLRMALNHITNNKHMKLHHQILREINRLLNLTPQQMWDDIGCDTWIADLWIDDQPAILELQLLSVSITDPCSRCCFNHVGRPPYFSIAPEILDNQIGSFTRKRASGELYNLDPQDPLWSWIMPDEDPQYSISYGYSTTLQQRLVAYHMKLDQCIRLRIREGHEFEQPHEWSNRTLQQMLKQQYLWQPDENTPYQINPIYYKLALPDPETQSIPNTGFNLLTLYQIDPSGLPNNHGPSDQARKQFWIKTRESLIDGLNQAQPSASRLAQNLLKFRQDFHDSHPDNNLSSTTTNRRIDRINLDNLETAASNHRLIDVTTKRINHFVNNVMNVHNVLHKGLENPNFKIGAEHADPDYIRRVTEEELREWIGEDQESEDEEEEAGDHGDSLFGDVEEEDAAGVKEEEEEAKEEGEEEEVVVVKYEHEN